MIPRDPVTGVSASKNSDADKPKKTVERCRPESVRRVGTVRTSYAAVVRKRAIAFRRPGRVGAGPVRAPERQRRPTVFAVLAKRVDRHCGVSWYRVQLPMKPNGITGWVRPYAVDVVP